MFLKPIAKSTEGCIVTKKITKTEIGNHLSVGIFVAIFQFVCNH